MKILKWLAICVFAVIALLPAGLAFAEVSVVVGSDGISLSGGPYVSGIIEDADPINLLVWNSNGAPTATRVLLNQEGVTNGDGRPAVVRSSVSGLPLVVWGKHNGSGFDVVESHFVAGAWTSPSVIAANVTTALDPEPNVVVDRLTGDVHLVYFANDSFPAVMHSEAPADLSSWSPPTLASQLAEYALRPSAAIHQGTLLVAYESHGSGVGSTPRQIVVATDDGLGGFSHQAVTSTHFGDPNRPELHVGMGGSLWLDWVDGDSSVAWAVWQQSSGWGVVQTETFTDLEDREYHVRGRIKQLANP